MPYCRECAFIKEEIRIGNCICSILKLKHPYEPGLYLKNPNEKSCSNFKKVEINSKCK